MVEAYVLIQTEVGKAAQVAMEVDKIDGVKAAQAVTGVDLPTLQALVDQSLLWRARARGRFQILHPWRRACVRRRPPRGPFRGPQPAG